MPGEQPLARAGGDQDPLGLDRRRGRRRLAGAARERQRMRTGDVALGFEQVDLVLAEQEAHALGELVGGLAAAL